MNVTIGDYDPLGSFVFRTTGFNSIRTLVARLQYFQAISGNRLSCLPLELRLRGKSTRQSHGAPIFYVDITARSGETLAACLSEAKQNDEERTVAGFDQDALDAAARLGLSNGTFEDSEDEASEVVEEFFAATDGGDGINDSSTATKTRPSLIEKLDRKVANAAGGTA